MNKQTSINSLNLIPRSQWFPKYFGDPSVGTSQNPLRISGPCSIESPEQLLEIVSTLSKEQSASRRIHLIRAGVWKPRTRPNSFEGLGEIALPWIADIKKEFSIPFAIEVANAKHVELALKHGIDILWIGARSTVNPFTVQDIADALRGVDIPVMVKNPINADLELWIGALERLNHSGIQKLMAIHRGFSQYKKNRYRNTPLWKIPLELKVLFPELPIICDPSHITGNRDYLLEVSQMAMDLAMDGLMLETHPNPDLALSDKNQQVPPQKILEIFGQIKLKSEVCQDERINFQIENLRKEIDILDNDILELLSDRSKIVSQIANAKLNSQLTALQKNRFESLLNDRQILGEKLNLDSEFIQDLFHLIHEESLKNQIQFFENHTP